ncbi:MULTISPECIES: sulfatase [Haloferacaceae]|uniref:Sulfatase n=1 Tax=Halorubrum glutamatedens TaxID=2707018 RepID=A0ABD5QU15_9EURY|nr:sulfatase [Halobellus captivus]
MSEDRSEDRPNVVWITLESVRAANASVCGYDRETTPNLSRIAERPDGVSFPNCFSQSMWTPASSASILTGTYLSEHRVGYDGKAEEPLPEDVATLPGLLREQGYRTACLTPSSYLSEATGLDRGFERHHLFLLRKAFHDAETRRGALRYLLRSRSYGPGFSLNVRKHNQTYVMQETLKPWLDSLSSDDPPFFLYTHCPNPHLPYTPPRKWIERFTDDIAYSAREALELSLETYDSRDRMIQRIADGCPFTSDEWDALRAMYDAEIAYADEFVGTLFDHVRKLDAGKTLFVVTADHGDLFGEQGILGHNLVLHDHLTNVPMVVSGLDGIAGARDSVVQHVDVTRTVAERLGVSHEQFSGVDLRETAPDYALSQRGVPHFDEYLEADPEFDVSRYHETPVTALRTDEFKYLKGSDRTELFELPDEETDVGDERPAVRDRLDGRLEDAFHGMTVRDGTHENNGTAEYSAAMEQQLADLGYL